MANQFKWIYTQETQPKIIIIIMDIINFNLLKIKLYINQPYQ